MRRDVLIICGLLLVLIAVQLIWPIRAPVPDFRAGKQAGSDAQAGDQMSSVELPESPAVEHYDAMRRRPLFVESRRAPGEDSGPVAEVTTRAVEKPRFRLIGIIIDEKETFAMIASPKKGAKSSRLQVGDIADGWEVKEITNDRLVLKSGGDQQELLLRTYKPVQPASSSNKKSKAASARSANAGKRSQAAEERSAKVKSVRKRSNDKEDQR